MRWSSMRYSSMRWTHLIASVRRIADYLQRPFLTVLTARLTSALLLTLPLVAYYWLLTTGCLLLVAYYWLLTTGCLRRQVAFTEMSQIANEDLRNEQLDLNPNMTDAEAGGAQVGVALCAAAPLPRSLPLPPPCTRV